MIKIIINPNLLIEIFDMSESLYFLFVTDIIYSRQNTLTSILTRYGTSKYFVKITG